MQVLTSIRRKQTQLLQNLQKVQVRHLFKNTRATAIRDQDITEELWTDWYRENKWKQHLGTRGIDELDREFLEQDFLQGVDITKERNTTEDFESFTEDIMYFQKEIQERRGMTNNISDDPKESIDSDKHDFEDEDYYRVVKTLHKQNLKEDTIHQELNYLKDLKKKLAASDQRGTEYEVVLPTGEIFDYDSFKNSLNSSSDRAKSDPYKFDARDQFVDMQGRTVGRGGHNTARCTVIIQENPLGEGMTYVNGQHYVHYYRQACWRLTSVLPLMTTGTFRRYDVFAFCRSGGYSGQSKSMSLALARALVLRDPSLRLHLQPYGFLYRDNRQRIRKYPGFKGARKRMQYQRR